MWRELKISIGNKMMSSQLTGGKQKGGSDYFKTYVERKCRY